MGLLLKSKKLFSSTTVAILLILAYGLSGIGSLHNFGISWDEGLGNLFFGERYYLYFQTQQEKFLDFKTNLAFHKTTDLNLYLSPLRGMAYQHPPIVDVPSAWMMHTFSYDLKWMDPVDAFHLSKVLLTILFLFIFYFFIRKRLGQSIAFWSLLFLVTFPRLWGDMQINPKDVSSLVFFTFLIFSYIYWYEKPGWKRAILVGLCFGLGLGNKANILFSPFVLFFGWLPWRRELKFWTETWDHLKKNWYYYVVFGVVSSSIYLATWPYLFGHPERNLEYFRSMATQGDRIIQYIWSLEPLEHMLATMPELMLVFLIIGLSAYKKNDKNTGFPWYRLSIVWFVLPILRISMPGQINFDGIRHYYEYLPAAALLAGLGVNWFADWLKAKFVLSPKIVSVLLGLLIIILGFANFKNYYPYTYIYYNQLTGGITGAERFFSDNDTTDYWGISYREGLNWINTHAEPNSQVYVPVASWLVEIPAKIWVRPDIAITKGENADSVWVQENPVYVMFINRPGYYNNIIEEILAKNLQPVYQRDVAGKPILFIYKITSVMDK
jgi:hypothetical protein